MRTFAHRSPGIIRNHPLVPYLPTMSTDFRNRHLACVELPRTDRVHEVRSPVTAMSHDSRKEQFTNRSSGDNDDILIALAITKIRIDTVDRSDVTRISQIKFCKPHLSINHPITHHAMAEDLEDTFVIFGVFTAQFI